MLMGASRKRTGTVQEVPLGGSRKVKSHLVNGKSGELYTEEEPEPTGMVGGLFYKSVYNQVQKHKEDTSKAAIQLNAYMSYLKDDDQKGGQKRQEMVTEEREEGDNDTSRGFLLKK